MSIYGYGSSHGDAVAGECNVCKKKTDTFLGISYLMRWLSKNGWKVEAIPDEDYVLTCPECCKEMEDAT